MRAASLVLIVLAMLSAPAPGAARAAAPGNIELRADEVTVRGGGEVIEARGSVRITDGRSVVRAGRARYSVRTRRIELAGGVAVDSSEGDLRAGRALLHLGPDRRITGVEASEGAALTAGGRRLEAERVSYTIGGPSATASGNVRLRLPPDIVATGDRLTLRGAVAVLEGGAKVETAEGAIEGQTIEVAERDRTAFVRGGVRAVFGEMRITSNAATLYGPERRAVFRDNVTVVQPGRTMKASLVTVFIDEKRLVAEGETTIRIDEERPGP